MRVLLVFGTRPEAIKMAPVILALRQHPQMQIITCVTAQHRQMLDQVLEWFKITPDFDLNLMQSNQTLSQITARALEEVSKVVQRVKPDMALVQGDTTTAMATALASFYERVPVGHIEAGLRTHNIYNPFPEEVNRHLISVMATYHFAPTKIAYETLIVEGIPPEQVFLTGNTVIDALKWTLAQPYRLELGIPLDIPGERLILLTAHRRESFGREFENICTAVRQIVVQNPDVRVVYPVHLNPNVQEPVRRILEGLDRVHLLQPLGYAAFVHLMERAYLILTDSGGVQEEAPALGKSVLVLRHTTERPEVLETGAARLVGTGYADIVSATQSLLDNPAEYQRIASSASSPFGDGTASEQIARILCDAT